MTTAITTANAASSIEPSRNPLYIPLVLSTTLRDVCLRIPLPVSIDDEQLERINQRNPGWKIERGADTELEVQMIAGGAGSDIAAELLVQIGIWCKDSGGGRVRESDGTFNLRDRDGRERTRAPDVSWISPTQLAATPRAQRPRRGFWNLCPAFVIEVRSPSDTLLAQQRRMGEWLAFGAELGWLVDPLEQTVWIYRTGAEAERLAKPSSLSGEAVLPGLVIDASEVWALLDAEASEADNQDHTDHCE